MKREDILIKLQEIFQDAFDDDTIILTEETNAYDIEGWDSLQQIIILSSAENLFKIKLAISDTRNLKNIGALVDVIERKVN